MDWTKQLWKDILKGRVKGELTFTGEEFIDRWGETTRSYPESFRAILHFIDAQKLIEVNSYAEIRTARKSYQDDFDSDPGSNNDASAKRTVLYKPTVSRPFKLIDSIYCEVTYEETTSDDKKAARQATKRTDLRVFSSAVDANTLKDFVGDCMVKYDIHVKEEIDKNQYYFVTKIEKIDDQNKLMYDQYEFKTNRSFNNIFYRQKEELMRRLDFFLNNKEWYAKRGVPYTLGFLFYGPPGTGKTSTIKAIAAYTKRHIIEVSLGRIKTYRELQRVFHETTFCDKFIPHHKIIYILEDIDCLDDIVKSRDGDNKEFNKDADGAPKKRKDDSDEEKKEDEEVTQKVNEIDKKAAAEYQIFKEYQKAWNKDPLTLSHILNILDGLLETPGRILIITTNHPEKLDSALIRPGRVDMKVSFGNASIDDTVKIVEMFYEKEFPKFDRARLVNHKFSAAEIYNICFQETKMEDAIERLQRASSGILSQSVPVVVKKETKDRYA